MDAKVVLDDNALFRHAELEELRDESEEDPLELEAKRYELNFVALEGSVGCVVNGAGLALATLDILRDSGGEAANFMGRARLDPVSPTAPIRRTARSRLRSPSF